MDKKSFDIFDNGVERAGTNATKWDNRDSVFGNPDVVPMWVADTDFPAPQEVIDALVARAQHGAFGYSAGKSGDKAATIAWMHNHHGAQGLTEDMLMFTPGVVTGLYMAVLALTEPGDKIAIQTPVYGPFHMVTKKAGRTLVEVPMRRSDDYRWTMDLDKLEEELIGGVKMLIFCSPHNPIGRVWTRDELTALVSLMNKYNAILLSDEIHCDLIMPGHKQTPICCIPGAEKAIFCIAPSKTFNLAGLHHSYMVIRDPEMRKRCADKAAECSLSGPNTFSEIACAAAYTYGEPWLAAQNEYLDGNRRYVLDFFAKNIPDAHVTDIEGTYLMWIDFSAWGKDEAGLKELFVRNGIGMNGGTFFGKEYGAYCRLNIGTPRKNVEKAMQAILKAYNEVH